MIIDLFPMFLVIIPQNLPVDADCVGSLKLTYISKVSRTVSYETDLRQQR